MGLGNIQIEGCEMVVDPPHIPTEGGGGAPPVHAKGDNPELLIVTGLSLRGILPP